MNFCRRHPQPFFPGCTSCDVSRSFFGRCFFASKIAMRLLAIIQPGSGSPACRGQSARDLNLRLPPSQLTWIDQDRLAEFSTSVSTTNETLEHDAQVATTLGAAHAGEALRAGVSGCSSFGGRLLRCASCAAQLRFARGSTGEIDVDQSRNYGPSEKICNMLGLTGS